MNFASTGLCVPSKEGALLLWGVNGFYEFLLNVSFGATDKQYKNAQAIVRICPHVAKPKTAKCHQAAVLDTPETDNKSGD